MLLERIASMLSAITAGTLTLLIRQSIFEGLYSTTLDSVVPSLIIFGDSLNDCGMTKAYSNYTRYWGGRYSNSYMWNEYSAHLLGLKLENWAYGGSTTSNKVVLGRGRKQLIPSVRDTVVQYIANNSEATDYKKQNSIVVIDGGGNDIIYSSELIRSGRMDVVKLIKDILSVQFETIELLLNAGYKKIYIMSVPDLSLVPAMAGSEWAHDLFANISEAIYIDMFKQFVKKHGDKAAGVKMFDIQKVMAVSTIPENLSALNITNSKDMCITYTDNDLGYVECIDPDTHYFYDDFHPSGRPHYLIGAAFTRMVKSEKQVTIDSKFVQELINEYNIAHSDRHHNIIDQPI